MYKIILIALMATLAMADVGKVAVVKGDASIERDVKVIKAHNNMGLMKQDVVETTQGRMQMLFNDNTVISLGRNSRFIIKEYLYVEDSQKVAATFRIEKGFIKTITGAIGKVMPELFVLETSNTKITPHGTIWSVYVTEDGEMYRVLNGRVTLAFNDGLNRKLELLAGETALLQKGKDGKVIGFEKNKIDKRNSNTPGYIKQLEQAGANLRLNQDMNRGTMINGAGEIVVDESGDFDDGNRGGGNDPGGVDSDNPGKGNKK